MNQYKSIISIFTLIFFISCGSGNQKASSLFAIELEGNPKVINQNDVLGVSIKNLKDKTIEKVSYRIDGEEIQLTNNKINFSIPKLGNKTLTAVIVYDGNTVEINKDLKLLAQRAPEIYTYTIINEYPHDTNAYTQGLEFFNDTLYEGTGQNGRSFLRKWDYKTGKVWNQVDLDKTYFGEGITILDGKIYQLTWKSGMGFIYDQKSMTKLDNFQYGKSQTRLGFNK